MLFVAWGQGQGRVLGVGLMFEEGPGVEVGAVRVGGAVQMEPVGERLRLGLGWVLAGQAVMEGQMMWEEARSEVGAVEQDEELKREKEKTYWNSVFENGINTGKK